MKAVLYEDALCLGFKFTPVEGNTGKAGTSNIGDAFQALQDEAALVKPSLHNIRNTLLLTDGKVSNNKIRGFIAQYE